MTGHIKMALCLLSLSALLLMTGCTDGPKAVEQPELLTKEDVKEAIVEASQPGEFTKEAVKNFEADKQRIKDQTKGYVGEDWERKKKEAQREYEELQRKKAIEESNKKAGNP